jgi:hypothetical protein
MRRNSVSDMPTDSSHQCGRRAFRSAAVVASCSAAGSGKLKTEFHNSPAIELAELAKIGEALSATIQIPGWGGLQTPVRGWPSSLGNQGLTDGSCRGHQATLAPRITPLSPPRVIRPVMM